MAVLEDVEQFRLQARIELGDFVHEQRAALGHFHAAGLRGISAGESALLKSEKLALDQCARNRRAIDFHKGSAVPGRGVVDEVRQNLFPGAAFAQNQNGNVEARGPLDLLPDGLHRLRRTKIDVVGRQFGCIYGWLRLE